MKIFNELLLKFEKPDWSTNPEFCVIDIILESRPDIILMLKSDITGSERASTFGRQDTLSVEQIVRAAIFKEMLGLDYRELEYAQNDSRICGTFIKLDAREPYTDGGYASLANMERAQEAGIANIVLIKLSAAYRILSVAPTWKHG
jgi:transposase, IS5 family